MLQVLEDLRHTPFLLSLHKKFISAYNMSTLHTFSVLNIFLQFLLRYSQDCDVLSTEEVKQKLLRCCDNMKAQFPSHPLPHVVNVKLLLGQCCAGQ